VQRLVPDPGDTTVEDQVRTLDLPALAYEHRPYVVTNFVISLDGRATLHGRSGPLGSDTDTQMLMGLRTKVDAVMIGAGTMRAERYGRPVPDPAKRDAREREGLAPDALMVIVSGRLDVPWDAPLFTEGGGRVLIFTASDAEPPETETPVRLVRHEGRVDLAAALAHLRGERGVRALLCEGGPRLHAQLLDAGLVDELFVTHAPKLAGGEGPPLAVGLSERDRPLELAWLLADGAELFARYRIPQAPGEA
jgi:riboflavin-specific deaminase-like protein